jgi:hypothetical protein
MGKVWKRRVQHQRWLVRERDIAAPAAPAPAEPTQPAPEAPVVETAPEAAPKKVRKAPRKRATKSDE